MRKTNCVKEINRYVNSFAKGAKSSKEKRKRTLVAIVDDLLKLGLLPNHLKELKDEYIFKLVAHWRTRGLSNSTLINRTGILRQLMAVMYDIAIPDNHEFNFKQRENKQRYKHADADVLDRVHHPITKTVLAFQVHFGLTKTESADITLDSAMLEDDIFISAKLASNGRDRFIPIVTKIQKEVIAYRQEVLGKNRKLTDRISLAMILQLVNAEICDCGYDIKAPFRRIYAVERLVHLSKTKTKKLATKMLVEELGYLNYQKLKEGLL